MAFLSAALKVQHIEPRSPNLAHVSSVAHEGLAEVNECRDLGGRCLFTALIARMTAGTETKPAPDVRAPGETGG